MIETDLRFNSLEERRAFFKETVTPIVGEACAEMMEYKGFLTAPASKGHHSNYEGGLFDHSVEVALQLQSLTDKLCLVWEAEDSAFRVGIIHDLCKIDTYKKVVDKPEIISLDFGLEVCIPEEFHYEWDNSPIIKGHGDKSVIYALNWGCPLTEEEIACITYHMGAYETDRWDAFSNAIKRFPNVLYTHTADMIADKIMGV